MVLPTDLVLSAEDLRYLRCIQLARLTDIDASCFSAWNQNRSMSERTLERLSTRLHLPKHEILRGFDLRRKDAAIVLSVHLKANRLIKLLETGKEPV
jgi:hypothetical protein